MQFAALHIRRHRTRHDNDIDRRQTGPPLAERLPDDPLDAVSGYRLSSGTAGYCQTEPRLTMVIADTQNGKVAVRYAFGVGEDLAELGRAQ